MDWSTGKYIQAGSTPQAGGALGRVVNGLQPAGGYPDYNYNFNSGITIPQPSASSQAITSFANRPPDQVMQTLAGQAPVGNAPGVPPGVPSGGTGTGVPTVPGVPPSIEAGTFHTNAVPGGTIGGVTKPWTPGPGFGPNHPNGVQPQSSVRSVAQAFSGIGSNSWGRGVADFIAQQRANGG